MYTEAKYRIPVTPAQLKAYRDLEDRFGATAVPPLPRYTITPPGRYKRGDYIGLMIGRMFYGIEADGYTHT